ncbi:MAG: FumA C-terminus/TtdB family hydratase beta subunit [Candidatus Omnitrophica bacterium]|nr:FumA C-terminus/TtdB family hydratase beta subunit [Candidatus Omnitrophota bacterium]
MKKISVPLDAKQIQSLKAGDEVLLTGDLFTARDQAHKRLIAAKKLPLDLKGQVIYYCGPTNTPKGEVIGSCGPTTSSRMDGYTARLLRKGLSAMIGKGRRSKEVRLAIKKHKAVYFLAYAGCGALVSKYVRKVVPVAYQDLGPEAIVRLEVKDLPLIVAIDSKGKDIYEA